VRRLLRRLLHYSGTTSVLRQQWRDDDVSTRRKIEAEFLRELRNEVTAVREEATAESRRHDESIRELQARSRAAEHEVHQLRVALAAESARVERRYPKALDSARVTKHVAKAIASADVRLDPMPHMVITSILPDDTYQGLLESIPPTLFFRADHHGRKHDLKFRSAQILPTWTRQAWSFIEHDVVPRMLVPSLMQKLAPYVPVSPQPSSAGASEQSLTTYGGSGGRLMLRRPGYVLAPHNDPLRTTATCLVYLAKPNEDDRYGTQLYRLNDTPVIDRTNTFYPEQHGYSCELVTTVPFTPNTLVIFLNGGAAAHGVVVPETAPATTERCAYQFYISADAATDDAGVTADAEMGTGPAPAAPAESSGRRRKT
jgi:hypothetical protein